MNIMDIFWEYKQLLTVDSWLLEPSTEPEKKVRVMESSSYREFEANYINGNKQISKLMGRECN